MINRLIKYFLLAFLVINFISRSLLWEGEGFVLLSVVFGGIMAATLFVIAPRFRGAIFFIFALGFPLFGWHSFSFRNLVFEFLVVLFALAMWMSEYQKQSLPNNSRILVVLALFALLSGMSVLLLPITSSLQLLGLWGIKGFSNALFTATPDSYLYSMAAINRLFLFFSFIYLISLKKEGRAYLRALFVGALTGGLWASILGILNQYDVLSLEWYQLWSHANRMHSVFGNPGWFAEYLCVVIPFALMGLLSKRASWIWKPILFLSVVIYEIAIISTGSRTGWVIFPLEVIFCLSAFVLFKSKDQGSRGRERTKLVFKVLAISLVTIAVGLFIVLRIIQSPKVSSYTVGDIHYQVDFDDDYKTMLNKRLSEKVAVGIRKKLWLGGLAIGAENPVFGMGYESYGWHSMVMGSIEGSAFFEHRPENFFDSPHNTYIQIFIGGGLIGLALFLGLILVAVRDLSREVSQTRDYFNLAVIFSLVGFFLYGLVQSMQYISMIWFLFFLNIGYAMTVAQTGTVQRFRIPRRLRRGFFVFIALAGLLVFIFHFESNHLARKYGRDGYGEGGNGTGYRGFFHLERSDFGSFRWSGKRGTIRFNQPGVVEFDYLCLHPDVEKKPVVFEVLLDGELIDEIVFVKKGKKKGRYYLSGAGGNAQTLRFEVSRTWNPRKYKINRDTRELGIGISPGYFVRRFPEDGVGFYEEEDMSVFPDGWAAGGAGVFRWTAKRASISIKQVHRERGLVFFVRASHPDLSPDSPVWLTVLGDRTKIRKIAVKNEWDRLQLSPEDLAGNRTITLRVNRTWVPRIYGVSEDDRNLGVAVAFE